MNKLGRPPKDNINPTVSLPRPLWERAMEKLAAKHGGNIPHGEISALVITLLKEWTNGDHDS